METEKHTPTPWHVSTNPGGPGDQPAFPSVRDASGAKHGYDIVAMPCGNSETVTANAAFIVRACNAHDDLLACCKWIHAIVGSSRDGGTSWQDLEHELDATDWANKIEAALALAEKEA